MKRSNFNPKEYETLNNVRKRIIKDFHKKDIFKNKKVLDIGCGTGLFSYELASNYKNVFVHGIDIVGNYIFYANKNNKYNNIKFDNISYEKIDGKYDIITMFLGLTEILKYNNFEKILNKLEKLLTYKGYVIICDEFIDDYSSNQDILGIEIMETIGYKYLNKNEFSDFIDKSNFEIVDTNVYTCKTQTTNFNGSKIKIFYENKLNEFDDTKKNESNEIWENYKNKVIETNGFRTNNLIRVYILRKKDLTKNNIVNIKTLNPTLIYDINMIKENINYYNDLKKEFKIDYLFPVKAFPNKKILEIFKKNCFGFDVSNKNELSLIDDKKGTFIMYSDSTNEIQNKNGIRINIYGEHIKSHFGITDDSRKSYEIVHLHVAESKNKFVLEEMIKNIRTINYDDVKILNIGGGYEELSYQQLRDFIYKIKTIIPKTVKLILEPGSIWFKNSGYLVTKVKKINNLRNIKYVYLNASKELHSKWSIPKIYYVESSEGNSLNNIQNYVFCGSTCYEKDIFCTYKSKIDIKENTKIIFNEIESYSYSWNSSFNGIEKAEVYFYE